MEALRALPQGPPFFGWKNFFVLCWMACVMLHERTLGWYIRYVAVNAPRAAGQTICNGFRGIALFGVLVAGGW